MNSSMTIQLLRTEPHACSYLPDLIATTEFVSPQTTVDSSIYQALNDAGFRRSGQHFYRPNCDKCSECKPLRIQVQDYQPTTSHKRILRKNAEIDISVHERPDPEPYFRLYESYIFERHKDGDMYPPDREQFDNFICSAPESAHFIEFRLSAGSSENSKTEEELIMVAVCDFLPQGLSAIYSFFDPRRASLSLGTFAILAQLNMAKNLGLPYLYLGYWIKDAPKMAYKSRFMPSEVFENGEWGPLPF